MIGTEKRPFVEGDRVVIVNHDKVSRCYTVVKVRKNGNFTLDDDSRIQWRQSGSKAGNQHVWDASTVMHADSDRVRKLVAKATLRRAADSLRSVVGHIAKSGTIDDIKPLLAECISVHARIKARDTEGGE